MMRSAARNTAVQILLLVGILLISRTLCAYEILRYSWKWHNHSANYRINPNFPDPEISGTTDQQIEMIRSAANVWRNQTGADFEFIYDGTTALQNFNSNDGVNIIAWSDSDGGDALAITVFEGIENRMTSFDILFFARTNGIHNRWNGPQDPASGTMDITGVAVHELGHALGLGHSTVAESTMFPSATGRGLPARTLLQDDRDGIEFVYGVRGEVDISPTITSLEPANGSTLGGYDVLIRGTNFSWTSDTTLRIGSQSISRNLFEIESPEVIRISPMPPGADGPVDLSIINQLGEVTLSRAFRYGPPPPSIESVEPDTGPVGGGIEVTIHGQGFSPTATILIGSHPLENLTYVDINTLTGVLPATEEPGSVPVELVQGIDTALLPEGFTYTGKTLRLGNGEGPPGMNGALVDVFVSSDEPLRGLSFAFRYDPALLAIDDISVAGTVAEPAEFVEPNIDNETGETTLGIVMSFTQESPFIPVGADQITAVISSTVKEETLVNTIIPLHIEEQGGSPPIQLLFTPVGNPFGVQPHAMDGSILVTAGGIFLRGDADGNEHLDLTDAIYHLGALFLGGPKSECPDSADSNDDGNLDISDAVYSLKYLYIGGSPPPPPFPDPGPDPTADEMGCR